MLNRIDEKALLDTRMNKRKWLRATEVILKRDSMLGMKVYIRSKKGAFMFMLLMVFIMDVYSDFVLLVIGCDTLREVRMQSRLYTW